MLPRKILILLVVAFAGQPYILLSQFHQTEIFTINDGLAMTECGLTYCDRSGKIWINHSTGWISVYDGYSFTRYSPQVTGAYLDGAQFVEDHQGLWIRKEKTISLFSNDQWTYFDAPEVWTITVDRKSDTMVLLDRSGKLWKVNKEVSRLETFAKIPPKKPDQEYTLLPSRSNHSYLLLITKGRAPYTHEKAYLSNSLIHPEWIETPSLLTPGPEWSYNFTAADQLLHVRIKFPKVRPNSTTLLTTSGSDLIFTQVYSISNGRDFIIENYKIDSTGAFQFIARSKSGHKNVSIALDKVGNIWAGSHYGLLKITPSIIQCIDNIPPMVPSLHAINEDDQGRIWFGGYTTGLCYFENEKLLPSPIEAAKFKNFLPGSYRDHKGKMAFWSEDHDLIIYDHGEWTTGKMPEIQDKRIVGYYFLPIQGNKIAAGLQRLGLGIVQTPLSVHSAWKLIGKEKGMHLDNVLTISEDSNHRLWLGRMSQGIAIYDPVKDTAQTWLLDPESDLNYGMVSSVIDSSGRIWMGCSDGLRVIDKPASFQMFQDELLSKINKVSLGEAGYSPVNILTTYKQFLIFGNSKGYAFLNLNSYATHPEMPEIHFFPTGKFGLSCEQNAVLIDQSEHLWIGHDRGAMRIDLTRNFLDTTTTQFVVKNITVHEENGDSSLIYFDPASSVKLPFGKRSITIRLNPSRYEALNNNMSLQYSLISGKNTDTLWSTPSKNFDIRLVNLPAGKNSVLVKGIKNNRIITQASYVISVPPMLTENFWFWFILFCLTSWIGYIFTRNVYRQRLQLRLTQINLAEEQREKNQFQISAIANSLNPHFIKNTLMWMQSRFRKDEEVVDVIDKLSYNIGNVFAHSRKGNAFHSLEEEMKVTENFLFIQIATYGKFLNINFPDPKEWFAFRSISVPLLLFQIHVENAIEHGLRKKAGRDKNLSLAIDNDHEYLIVIIQDDGIGRIAAKERGTQGTNQGTSMLDRVIELYNQKNDFQFNITYIDLYDRESGLATGTRVEIRIPKHFKTELT